MRVKIGNYVNRWISNLHQEYMEKKYDGNLYDSVDQVDQYPTHRWYHNFLYEKFGIGNEPKVSVHIDDFDTWSMDDTLAPIILPMLKQLKTTQHGAGSVELSDVPKELHGKKLTKEQGAKGEVNDKHFERWDYVLDEMIWAFEQKCRDDWNDDYIDSEDDPDSFMGTKFTRWDDKGMKAHQKRMTNGFRLFGTYFENLWD